MVAYKQFSVQPPLHISSLCMYYVKDMWVGLYPKLLYLCYHPYLVPLLFAVLLSLHLIAVLLLLNLTLLPPNGRYVIGSSMMWK